MNNSIAHNNDLQDKPYITLPFPIDGTQIHAAMRAFFNFLELDELIKKTIDLKISPLHRRGELGYVHRDPLESSYNDSKDFFHYHPLILKKYKKFIENTPILKTFLEAAAPLWDAVYECVYAQLSLLEAEHPGALAKIFNHETPHIILRFLKYDFTQSGYYLAKPHFDSGSFTVAIAESNPGLRIGFGPDDLQLIEHRNKEALFMISSNIQKIIAGKKLRPAWHDVIQTDPIKVGASFARWALVAFIDGHSVPSLSRHETHQWAPL